MAEDQDWLVDSLSQFLRSPLWVTPLQTFVDEHCLLFQVEEECALEHTAVHQRFQELVDGVLTEHLTPMGITAEQFLAACAPDASAELNGLVRDFILALDDFLVFKTLMEKRNVELELEAMRSLKLMAGPPPPPAPEAAVMMAEEAAEERERRLLERRLLEAAIAASIMEEDLRGKELEMEEAQLEHALAISLAIAEHGADVDQDEEKNAALIHALKEEDYSTAQLLLERGAVVDPEDESVQSALIYAAIHGLDPLAKLLLERGAAVDHVESDGNTALICAAQYGHDSTVQLLLERGANVDHEDENKLTALSHAANNGHDSTAQLLLERGANVDHEYENKWTALIYAARNGHDSTAQLLLEHHEKLDKNTALLRAAEVGNMQFVQRLLERGVTVDHEDKHKKTALFYAAEQGHDSTVQLLIERGAAVNHEDKDKKTAPHYAAQNEKLTSTLCLLEHGASPSNIEFQGERLLTYLAKNGLLRYVELAIKSRADVDYANDRGETALLVAALNAHNLVVHSLLEVNASLRPTSTGFTPLMAAALSGNATTVTTLLANKADIHAVDDKRRSAFFYAYEDEAIRMLTPEHLDDLFSAYSLPDATTCFKQLEERVGSITNIDFDTGDKNHNWTILMEAALTGSYEIVRVLLSRQLNMAVLSVEGFSAYFWAKVRNDKPIVDLHQTYFPSTRELEGLRSLDLVKQNNKADAALLHWDQASNFKNGQKASRARRELISSIQDRMADVSIAVEKVIFYDASYRPSHTLLDFLLHVVIPHYEQKEEEEDTSFEKEIDQLKDMVYEGKKVATTHAATHGVNLLRPIDVFALFCYTFESVAYKKSNEAMRNAHSSDTSLVFWRPFIYHVDQALAKIDMTTCNHRIVFRGIPIPWVSEYSQKQMFMWNSFTSTSRDLKVALTFAAGQSRGLCFLIVTKRATDVQAYSAFPAEAEVLFRPNVQLRVHGLYTNEILDELPMVWFQRFCAMFDEFPGIGWVSYFERKFGMNPNWPLNTKDGVLKKKDGQLYEGLVVVLCQELC